MKTRQENEAIFDKFVVELAKHFPDYDLVQEPGRWNCYFVDKNNDSLRFYIAPEHQKGKFTVSSGYYHNNRITPETSIYVDGKQLESIDCGFSYTRDVEDVARAIKKRFLPKFIEYYYLVKARWDADDEYINGKENTLNQIVSALGVKISSNETYRYDVKTYLAANNNLKNLITSIRVNSKDSIDMHLSLKSDDAMKIIEFIKRM